MTILVGTSTKMNLTSTEAGRYLDTLVPLVSNLPDRTVFVLLPFTSIWVARDRLTGTSIGWGAQDVHPEDRGAGYGWMLADMAVSQARWRGVRRIYLLTESASDFFAAKFGFRVVDRSTLSKQVAQSETFGAPKGQGLVAMRLDL